MVVLTKPRVGVRFLPLSLRSTCGEELYVGAPGYWQVLFVFSGFRTRSCLAFLDQLSKCSEQLQALGVHIVAASPDTRADLEKLKKRPAWRFPVGVGLTLKQMRSLGLYLSCSTGGDGKLYPEPALFIIAPTGYLHFLSLANCAWLLPNPQTLLTGLARCLHRVDMPPGTR